VRGGSTVLVVKPLGRSLGESRLLLTRFVVNVGDKLRRYSGEVESSRVPWLLLAVLASFA